MLNFDEINDILNDMAEAGIVEPMVEPIDDPTVEVNFWDWADVVGAVDEFVPEAGARTRSQFSVWQASTWKTIS